MAVRRSPVSLRLPVELEDRLRAEAEARGVSLNGLIVERLGVGARAVGVPAEASVGGVETGTLEASRLSSGRGGVVDSLLADPRLGGKVFRGPDFRGGKR